MATANLPVEPVVYLEILDEEFQRYLEVTESLMKTLKRPKDREICAKFVRKCTSLDAPSIEVKQNRNEFFKYFLKMLQTAATNQPPQYDDWFKPKKSTPGEDSATGEKVSSFWSADKRTYVAAKAIPGFGTLVYLAVAYKPELGWESTGFSNYEF